MSDLFQGVGRELIRTIYIQRMNRHERAAERSEARAAHHWDRIRYLLAQTPPSTMRTIHD